MKKEICLILDNIRSAENVGSIFRTSDAVGVSKIFLIGITPCPIDRFGRERKDIAKSALGAEKTIEWEYRKNAVQLLRELKKRKFLIIALEQDEKALDYKKISARGGPAYGWKGRTALIIGNEVTGISKEILKMSDCVVEIPMKGKKESLNVSVATGVALYRLLKI
ncbi:MAG: TrmH family RNA methyltransferase [Patescibacteria group bacterium]